MTPRERLRRLVPGLASVLVLVPLYIVTQAAVAVGGSAAVAPFAFREMQIAMPPNYDSQPMNTIRKVNSAYKNIDAWISSVGASIAINDVTGHGRADGMCIVDTRTNSVIVTYAPTAPEADRFTPFVLQPAPLPYDETMAPTGCTPGDYNGDGRMDFLVSYWGRTPIMFLARATATTPAPGSYRPVELAPNYSPDGNYHGARWYTDAVYVGDLDGTGHPSIIVGNYFPESGVLDPNGARDVVMPNSLSSASNGGGDVVFQWYGAKTGAEPDVSYVANPAAIPLDNRRGWTLAVSGADLTGDGLPEVYIANDFGHGHLLYNQSTPGHVKFSEAKGVRTPTTPKSFVLGNGSFKGMGVDFGDLNADGKYDIMVSNITVARGLEESNFAFINNADDVADMKSQLAEGVAPFSQDAQDLGLAWTGWSWDVKMGDFLNSGKQEVVQADGFVKGTVNRWNWLQEMAMTNDNLLYNPAMWPNVKAGDDLAGHEALAFYTRNADGTYVNVSAELGLAVPTPTRGIATGVTTGSGALDLAVARQWGPPAFYANVSTKQGSFLDLNLFRPIADGTGVSGLQGRGVPAYGATVTVTTAAGTQVSQLDGGGGHSGYRSFGVNFGLGTYTGPVSVHVTWHDSAGARHEQALTLAPGTHYLTLLDTITEVSR
jgi:hypothetical protein